MTTHDRQFVARHTGIIYTPPHASDHVAVSLLLDDAAVSPRPLALALDEPTRACSFRPQKSISSFFAPRAASAGGEGGAGGGSKRLKT